LMATPMGTPEGVLTFGKAVMVKSMRLAKVDPWSVSETAVRVPLAIVTQSPFVMLVPVHPVVNVTGVLGVWPTIL
jgi:hypothetical protein